MKNIPLYIITTILIFITIFRLLYITHINLSPDEAYYWTCSRHLSLSYYDHPPLIVYLIWFSTQIFGNTELGVRLPAVIFSLGSSVLFYLTGRIIMNPWYAGVTVLLFNLIPLFAAGSIISTPDVPLSFCWILTVYLFLRYLKSNSSGQKYQDKIWYVIGIILGLGLLAKYTMVLIIPAILGTLTLSPQVRGYLRKKEIYLAGLICLLLFSPVLIWNLQNNFASFRFQLVHGLSVPNLVENINLGGTSFRPLKSLTEFILGQAIILTPLIFVGILYAIGYAFFYREKKYPPVYLFLVLCSIIPLLIFTLSSLRAKPEANWPAVAYFTGTILFVDWITKISTVKVRYFVLTISLISTLLVTVLVHYPGILYSTGIQLNNDPTDELYGWKEIGIRVGKLYQEMEGQAKTYIIANRYQIAAELSFYVPGQPEIISLNFGSRTNAYEFWDYPELDQNSNAIFVDGPIGRVEAYYTRWQEIAPLEIYRYGKLKHKFYLHQCYGYRSGLISRRTGKYR